MSVASINSIPSHVVEHRIFPLINVYDLTQCSQVCKLWNTFASADLLWQPIMQSLSKKLGPEVIEPHPLPTKDLKKFVVAAVITSSAELLSYFKKFARETALNQRNRFICASPFDSVHCVVDLGLGNINLSGMGPKNFKSDVPPDHMYLCIYLKGQKGFSDDNKLQMKIVNGMGPTANGEGSKISNAFLVLPSSDVRVICDLMAKRLEELELQNEAKNALYATIGLIIGIGLSSGIMRSCTLF